MDYKEIVGLMEEMTKNGLTRIKIENEGFKLVLEKETIIKNDNNIVPSMSNKKAEANNSYNSNNTSVTQEVIIEQKTDNTPSDNTEQYKKILSPMVGTFYAKPAPDKPPYVKVGDKIKKGQIVCIIEAMKLMNEIESDVEGEIVGCLVENEKMVEYGQPLFLVK